jgi:hypothetical protein
MVATKTSAKIAANSVTQSERVVIDAFPVTAKVLPFFDAYLDVRNAKQPSSLERASVGRNTVEFSILTSKELSRTFLCKGLMSSVSPRMLGSSR